MKRSTPKEEIQPENFCGKKLNMTSEKGLKKKTENPAIRRVETEKIERF